ncbi:MFS transporter [Ammoniphilus sp. CFH 90114]|uniref:MFS transporter n=1 Tax=Ammoniphilus sp. CFH 90114 TaxID=2493665 RepID=UPI00100FFA77|nr:MFS transporter [Ammoniphilus sp. CFH 90114]RXT05878.1 MFS transporter [Ammoniphilus sp. CFH 90114]
MELWKRNLVVLCLAQFLVMAGMSLVIPFLPLYLQQEMGIVDEKALHLWTGVIFGANFLSAFLFSPIWGKLADRHGRKIMLIRSGFGMAIVVACMGLATSPIHLLILRFLNGTISGFIPASIALVSTNTPKERSGYALGTLQAAAVGGSVCGPLLGGLLAHSMGYRSIFFVMGILLFVAAVMVTCLVTEINKPDKKKVEETGYIEDFKVIFKTKPLPALFASGFLIQIAMLGTTPFITSYVQELWKSQEMLALLAGAAISITGLATMIFSPFLGKWGDRIGSQYILFYALVGAGLFLIPHAFVVSLWQLFLCRFLLGMCIGGMLPSVNALIRHYAPKNMESRTYGYSNMCIFLGNMLGPLLGGWLSGWIGLQGVFLFAASLILFNAFWVKVQLLGHQEERKSREKAI